MEPYWKIVNDADQDAELLIYGEIVDEQGWQSNVTAPKQVADFIAGLKGKPLTVRINSGGGSVFAAHAIYNLIRAYEGKTTAVVDGLAASAASIIAIAADTVIMPKNAMMMIHDPMIYLDGAHNVSELQDYIEALQPIKASIIAAYTSRSHISAEKLADMMAHTTWMTADECVEKGFADAIVGAVHPVLDGNCLVVNHIRHDIKPDDTKQIKQKLEESPMGKQDEKDIKDIFMKFANMLGLTVADKEPAPPVENTIPAIDHKVVLKDAVAQEKQRLLALDALNDGTAVVRNIIQNAKETDKTVDDIKPIIDIIHETKENKQNLVKDMLADNADSGVNNVSGDPDMQVSDEAKDAIRTKRMAETLKNMYGGK